MPLMIKGYTLQQSELNRILEERNLKQPRELSRSIGVPEEVVAEVIHQNRHHGLRLVPELDTWFRRPPPSLEIDYAR